MSAYFLYVCGVAAARPIAGDVRALIWAANGAVVLWFCLFAWAHKGRGFVMLDHVRDWYPLPLILLAFREMGWMALPHANRNFENYWVRWDRALLHEWGLKAAIESLGSLGPNVLEFSYLFVYAVPVLTTVVFYWRGARERLDDGYSILLFGTLTTYALYPYFPSEPPRAVFPLDDLPLNGVIRALNLRILGQYGIHMSVFPSGHSAAAFSAAFAVMKLIPESKWTGRAFLALAVSIAVATVYGRYHYAVDAVAGLGMAGLSLLVSRGWRSRRRPD